MSLKNEKPMKIIISPAKKMNTVAPDYDHGIFSYPIFLSEIQELITILKKYSVEDIMQLMKVSYDIAKLNWMRFQNFVQDFNTQTSVPAIYLFQGDVYKYLDVNAFSEQELAYTQHNIRILSGLYGIIKPLDLIQPYRLEMGTKLINRHGKNLYEFWGNKIADAISQETDTIINLASKEYFTALSNLNPNTKVINIHFQEYRNDKYQSIGIIAKRLRGLMANYIVKNNIASTEDIKNFSSLSYSFSEKLSDKNNLFWIK